MMILQNTLKSELNLVYRKGEKNSKTKKKTKHAIKLIMNQVRFNFTDKIISEILDDMTRKCMEYGRPDPTTLITENSLKQYFKKEFSKKLDTKNFYISGEELEKLHNVLEREEIFISIGLRILFQNFKKNDRDLYLSMIILQLKKKIIAKEFIVFR